MTTQSTGSGALLPACDTDRAAGVPDGAARMTELAAFAGARAHRLTAAHSAGEGGPASAAHTEGAGAPVWAPTLRARLIDRRDALPRGSRKRAALDHRIREITHAMMRAAQ